MFFSVTYCFNLYLEIFLCVLKLYLAIYYFRAFNLIFLSKVKLNIVILCFNIYIRYHISSIDCSDCFICISLLFIVMSELLFECYNVPQVAYGVDSLYSFYGYNTKLKGNFKPILSLIH